ncbi:serpin B6-like [Amphibalanus amphitrite]|uniref:serpin B6-like n=1 Tax=Amphibalanus amphitrite TaxID=1232801 RepID=UPI001C923820|nr:serpin B6-like [Amphibalanus amphitrite]
MLPSIHNIVHIWLIALLASTGGCYVQPTGVLNGLDLKLLKAVTSDLSANRPVSPFVMSTLLSQVWLGARGVTRSEMTPVLGVRPNAPDSFLPSYKSAITYLSTTSANVNTSVFNGIYVKDDTTVKQSFADDLQTYYGAEVNKFSTAKEAADDINAAVAQTTNNLIRDLVSEGGLQGVKMVLVSALYFKALWLDEFPDMNTKQEDFLTNSGIKQVPMMKLKQKYMNYVKIAGKFDAISLPYRDTDYSMVILRPLSRSMSAVQTMLNSLDSVDLAQLTSQMQSKVCDVHMPRFEMKAKYDNLKGEFQSMGMNRVFSNMADLSGISTTSLKVDQIILEVFMNVTEVGTEAAGAAAITIGVTSVIIPPPTEVEFILDRPFIAVVWNSKHKMSLFEAYVGNP